MRKHVLGAGALAVLAALGVAAWPATSHGTVAEPPIGQLATVAASGQIRLPLDAYQLSRADLETVDLAAQELRRRCAARFGIVSTERGTADLAVASNARRYGIADAKLVERWGYHAPPAAGSKSGTVAAPWNPSGQEYLVMTGSRQDGSVPEREELPRGRDGRILAPGGCAAESNRQLSGGQHVDPGYIEALGQLTLTASEHDSRVRAATHRWSDCMRDHGYSYDSPWQPNDTEWGDAPSPKEKATARDDLACRRGVRLLDVWVAVDAAYQRRIETQYGSELSRWERIRDDQVRRARTVVASSG